MTRNSNKLLIAASFVLNLALAVAVAHLGKTRFSKPPDKVSIVTNFVSNMTAQKISTETPQAVTNFSPLAFHWREIESEDYSVYIANLRKINCPEKTIRSILIPDIEDLYDKRRHEELEPPATNFWVSGRARVALNRERQQKARALETEESALIKQLLGIDWFGSERRRGFSGYFEKIVIPYLMTATLSIEKSGDFSTVMQKYERIEREIQDETGGILLPADEAKMKEMKSRMKSEIVQLITAQESEEFNLRMAAIQGFEIFEDLKDSDLVFSPDEYRKIMQLTLAGRNMPFEFKIFGSGPEDDLTPQQKKEIEQATKTFLGDARYAKFVEATDDTFRSAKSFVEKEKLPPQTSRALFDIQQAAESQAEQIRANQSLSAADRKRALQEVSATTEAAVAEAVGAKLLEKYRQNNGGWLKEIVKKQK